MQRMDHPSRQISLMQPSFSSSPSLTELEDSSDDSNGSSESDSSNQESSEEEEQETSPLVTTTPVVLTPYDERLRHHSSLDPLSLSSRRLRVRVRV